MHELAITESVVDAVCEVAAGRRVHRVLLEVGVLTAVIPDAMQFCFELATEGTVAEGAVLEIRQTPGKGSCRSCRTEFTLIDQIALCRCGSADVEILAGRDLKILSMEVSEACAQPADAATPTVP